MILIIDHYDSFVASLGRYVERLGAGVQIIRQDAMSARAAFALMPDAIILSPGPATPDAAGMSLELVRLAAGKIPVLGVCLGHQILAVAHGGTLKRTPPMHGVASMIAHDGRGIFAGLANPLQAGRYHALSIESLAEDFRITAQSDDIIMGFQHKVHPLFGVQFHPESILTPAGEGLIANFLHIVERYHDLV